MIELITVISLIYQVVIFTLQCLDIIHWSWFVVLLPVEIWAVLVFFAHLIVGEE